MRNLYLKKCKLRVTGFNCTGWYSWPSGQLNTKTLTKNCWGDILFYFWRCLIWLRHIVASAARSMSIHRFGVNCDFTGFRNDRLDSVDPTMPAWCIWHDTLKKRFPWNHNRKATRMHAASLPTHVLCHLSQNFKNTPPVGAIWLPDAQMHGLLTSARCSFDFIYFMTR